MKILDDWPKIFAAVSFATIMSTVVHDWGYFSIIGQKFQSIQTTYDYLSNSIEWLPISVVFQVSAFAVAQIWHQALPQETENEFVFQDQRARATTRRQKRALNFHLLNAGIMLLAMLTGPTYARLAITPLFCSGVFMTGILILQIFALWPLSRTPTFIVRAASIIAAAFFSLGVLQAALAIDGYDSVYRISNKEKDRNVTVLRSFEKGLLVWDASNKRAEFVRWDSVDRLSHVASPGTRDCGLITIFCSERPPDIPER